MGCDSLDVIGWGIREGKQRFKCKQCGLLLTRTNQGVSKKNRFIWFKDWIEGKQTFGQIATKSGYSERTLKRYFYDYLSDYPTWQIRKKEKVNLLIDGTYFTNKVCLILYRSDTIKATLFYRLTDGEWFEELVEDLSNLTSLGIEIDSVTCDGLSNIIKAVKKASPQTTIQRCLAHIQRETLIWLTKHPQSIAGQELRYIILKIHRIETKDQWGYWVVELIQWHSEHQSFINQKS